MSCHKFISVHSFVVWFLSVFLGDGVRSAVDYDSSTMQHLSNVGGSHVFPRVSLDTLPLNESQNH